MPVSVLGFTPFIYLLALSFWCFLIGNPLIYWFVAAPAGQGLYFCSKLLGVLAISGAGWQATMGVLTVFSRGEKRARHINWHRINGAVTLFFACAHMVCFITAASIRSGHFAGQQLLPDFSSYYQTHIFIGVIALSLLLLTAVRPLLLWHSALRGFERVWHSLAVLVFPFGLWHSLTIGSETRNVVLLTLFSSLSLLLLWALGRRVFAPAAAARA